MTQVHSAASCISPNILVVVLGLTSLSRMLPCPVSLSLCPAPRPHFRGVLAPLSGLGSKVTAPVRLLLTSPRPESVTSSFLGDSVCPKYVYGTAQVAFYYTDLLQVSKPLDRLYLCLACPCCPQTQLCFWLETLTERLSAWLQLPSKNLIYECF